MRSTRALFAVLLVCSLVVNLFGFYTIPLAAAQESPDIGDPIPVTNEEGTPVGSITVTEVLDPFTDVNPDYPAEAGSRYVVASVAFDADAGQRFDITPYSIVLQDDAGFLWNQVSLVLPDDALIPELSSQTLAPGSRVTGLVGFVVPEDRTPARIIFQPESSRIVTLADLLGEPGPMLGEAVPLPDSEGGVGSVTVSEVVDPFEDIDPTQLPPEGTRLVLVTLVYENTGDGRFFIEPYGLVLQDANGNLWSSTSVTRLEGSEIVPDLSSAQLAPGDRVSGALVFAVPVGVALAGVYDSPVSGQLVQLADLRAGEGEAATEPSTEEIATPIAEESASTATGVACAELEVWLAATRDRIARAAEMSVEDAELEDPESLAAHVAEYADLAEAQRTTDVPANAEAVNKALVATLNAYGASIQQILDANDSGEDATLELTEAMNTFNAAGGRLQSIEGELARLAGECDLS
jgi:hypothetical protein